MSGELLRRKLVIAETVFLELPIARRSFSNSEEVGRFVIVGIVISPRAGPTRDEA
jgi:hypothetical protein